METVAKNETEEPFNLPAKFVSTSLATVKDLSRIFAATHGANPNAILIGKQTLSTLSNSEKALKRDKCRSFTPSITKCPVTGFAQFAGLLIIHSTLEKSAAVALVDLNQFKVSKGGAQ